MSEPRPLRVALIGCGSYGAQHAEFFARCPEVKFHAVADIALGRAETFAAQYGAGYATSDVARVFDDTQIDAVWISTQHHTHAPLAEQAAAAGKNFFLEKPLALTLADCDRIVAAVERSGVIAASGFKLRFFPAVLAAKQFITKPQLTTGHVIDDHWPSEFWANDPVQGGGNVLSQGCHMMDTILHLHASLPVRVYAAGGNRNHPAREIIDTAAITLTFADGCVYAAGGNRNHPAREIIDTAAITLTFADGAVANLSVGDVGVPPHASKFALQTSDGARSLSLYNRLNSLMTRVDGKITEHPAWPEDGAAVIDREFIKAVATGGPSPVTVQSARRTTAVVIAAIESIKTRQAVDLTTGVYAAAMAV